MSIELSGTELLSQISQMMDQQTDKVQQMMDRQTEAMEQKMQRQMQINVNLLKERMDQFETRVNLKIENEITKKIESLFDGYKLCHEKQWELERKLEKLERRVDGLENRIA